MLEQFIGEIDFAKYHRWLTRSANRKLAFAVCGADGSTHWISPDALGSELAAELALLATQRFAWPFDGGSLAAHPLANGAMLLYCPLDTRTHERVGWLAVMVERFGPDAAPVELDHLAESLEDVGASIIDECRLRFDLGSMTEELADRYEELHLVYGVDQKVRQHGQKLEVFQSLLHSCAEQMHVDVVAFVCPSENLCLSSAQPSKPIHNLDLVLVEMRGDLFRFVQSTRETVVLNEFSDPRRAYVFTDMPYKILSSPVRAGNAVTAQLVLLNHADKPDFSNSDRRLAEVLANQLSSLTQTYTLIKQLGSFNEQIAAALIEAVEAKDPYTRGHSERVHHLSMEIGRALDLPEDDLINLYWGSLLHDVGKIGIPDAVLCKPSRLTRDEYSFIMVHPERSYEILRHIDYLKDAVPGARHHQEKYDGTGYPHGLKGERIPLHARIIAVADTYDSITSSRAYRAGRTHEESMREIARVSGTQLDPGIVAVFRTLCDQEPEWFKRFDIKRERKTEAALHG